MSRTKQSGTGNGSLKDIQILINNNSDLLNALIINRLPKMDFNNIEWLSPLANDSFAEYSDDDFIKILGLDQNSILLNNYWPNGGPHWDALGRTDKNEIFLIEAKANIPEIVSPGTLAKDIDSIDKINRSLELTKGFLNIHNSVNWNGKFYQYTNRLAHLYFFRVIHNIPAFLINIYFMNDKTVNGPQSKAEWLAAIEVLKKYLGIGEHSLSKYMIDLFIDVDDLRK